jgi:hypothetical protein
LAPGAIVVPSLDVDVMSVCPLPTVEVARWPTQSMSMSFADAVVIGEVIDVPLVVVLFVALASMGVVWFTPKKEASTITSSDPLAVNVVVTFSVPDALRK